MLPAMRSGVTGRNATAMPSKDCHTRQSQTARIELELKRDIYSEMSRYPGNHRSGCLPPGPRSTEKGVNHSTMASRKATDQRAGNIVVMMKNSHIVFLQSVYNAYTHFKCLLDYFKAF